MRKNVGEPVRIPDVEIVVQAAASDVLVVSFFHPANPNQEVEIIATLSRADAKHHLVACLNQAIALLNGEDWFTMAELDTGAVSDEGKPPF